MNIRRATLADKDLLLPLLRQFELDDDYLPKAQRDFRAFRDPESAIQEDIEKWLSGSNWIVLIAEENGGLQGFISGEVKEKKHRINNKEGYIDSLFVTKESRGKGIGKLLMDSISKEFKELYCTHLALATHLDNKVAMSMYESMGFIKRLVLFFKPL